MKTNLLSLLFVLFSFLGFSAKAQTLGIPCPEGCTMDPLCVIEENCFRFEYYGAIDQGNGTTQLKFKIYNASRFPFEHVMFELPGQNLPAVSPKAAYSSRFSYSVQPLMNDSLIKFTGINTLNYRYDQNDVFRYVVDSATFHNGYNSTIEIVAKAGQFVAIVNFNLEECDDMPINPLPVELVSFKGSAVSQGVALDWETASEKNNAFFSIQHSTDGRNFESVGYVEGNGTTAMAHKYSFTHTQPAAGKNYYRLKQVDHDGTSAYSKIVVIESKGAPEMKLSVFPNPVTNGEVNLKLERALAGNETATVQVRDLNGRLILDRSLAGAQTLKLNLKQHNLKPGIYLISLQNGAAITHQKIVVQ
jgi:hypothetical protein